MQNIKHVLAALAIASASVSAPASAAIFTYEMGNSSSVKINTDDNTVTWTGGGTDFKVTDDRINGTLDNQFENVLNIPSNNANNTLFFQDVLGATTADGSGLARFSQDNITYTQDASTNAGFLYFLRDSVSGNVLAKYNSNFTNPDDQDVSNLTFSSNITSVISNPTTPPTTSVPEPGALGLMALGLFGLAVSSRRRRKPVLAAA